MLIFFYGFPITNIEDQGGLGSTKNQENGCRLIEEFGEKRALKIFG